MIKSSLSWHFIPFSPSSFLKLFLLSIWTISFSGLSCNLSDHYFFTSWQILPNLGQFGEESGYVTRKAWTPAGQGRKRTDQCAESVDCSLIGVHVEQKVISNAKSYNRKTFWRLFFKLPEVIRARRMDAFCSHPLNILPGKATNELCDYGQEIQSPSVSPIQNRHNNTHYFCSEACVRVKWASWSTQ